MTHVPHQLAAEFPDKADQISKMEQTNAHFARLTEEYDEVNRIVHKAETNVAPMDDLAESEMRKKRTALKDEIYQMLTKSA
ncbi:YdcH family protein [Roseovarius dicentrarchi]|uniref:YdcH family protein n=1 Tax=Roseovarius dicentrarchi TaxID=2250573 RepID=UPI000DE98DB2|nr:YdcH family protein [Roseovarius dicentrarchi]